MISSVLLFATWLLVGLTLSKRTEIPTKILPALALPVSQSLLFIVYFGLVFLGSNPLAGYILLGYMTLLIIFLGRDYSSLRLFTEHAVEFLFPRPLDFNSNSLMIKKSTVDAIFRIRVITTIILFTVLLLTSWLMAEPSSWDAYTYNLARIVQMIIRSTPFLLNSPSIPHAVFPLGHDLLFYPDILFGNLRGLSTINLFEYVIMTGVAITFLDYIQISVGKRDDSLNVMVREASRLLTICIVMTLDLQLLQALSVKNDFAITLFFMIASLISLNIVASNNKMVILTMAICSLPLVAYAYLVKSYGLLCLIPIIFAFLTKIILTRSLFFWNIKGWHQSLRGHKKNMFLFGFCLALSLSLIAISLNFQNFISTHYQVLPEFEESVNKFIGHYSSISDISFAAFLNISRYLLNLIIYPYSLIVKVHGSSQNDYLIGLAPIVRFLASNRLGMADGYSYGLIRYNNEDTALAGPFFHLLLVFTSLTTAYCILIFPRPKQYFTVLIKSLSISSVSLLIVSSGIALISFCAILTYHNWYGKYLGLIFLVPVPVLVSILVFNIVSIFFFDSPQRRPSSSGLRLILTFLIIAIVCLSTIITPVFQKSRYFGLPYLNQSKEYINRFYYDYLYSVGYLTYNEKDRFVRQFRNVSKLQTKTAVVCFGEETPSLIPLLELLRNKSRPANFIFASIDSPACASSSARDDVFRVILP